MRRCSLRMLKSAAVTIRFLSGITLLSLMFLPGFAQSYPSNTCQKQTVKAYVVAIDRALVYNRFGAEQPGGMIFALARDVYPQGNATTSCRFTDCTAGQVKLRASKRPRPLVLRVNEGDDLEIHF